MKLSTEKLKALIAGWMAQKPKSDLAHHYVLVVVTTPEDDDVIGWSLGVD